MRVIRLTSDPMCYTPGIVKYLKAAYRGGDKTASINALEDGYGIDRSIAYAILTESLETEIDGRDFVVYVPEDSQ